MSVIRQGPHGQAARRRGPHSSQARVALRRDAGWIDASCIERLTRSDFDARPGKRTVLLGIDEVAELWRALGDPTRCSADPVTVAALRLPILTGQREREVTDATWDEFDLDRAIWKIPAKRTKSERAHLVHLAPQAPAIFPGCGPGSATGTTLFRRRSATTSRSSVAASTLRCC